LETEALQVAIIRAASKGDFAVCQALIDFSPELLSSKAAEQAVRSAAKHGRHAAVHFFLEACLKRGDTYQKVHAHLLQSALQAAVCSLHCKRHDLEAELVRYLIRKGADVNAGQSAFTESSLLASALKYGHTQVVHLLLSHGAHVHADPSKPKSKSALAYAIHCLSSWRVELRLEVCKVLLSFNRVSVGAAELCAAVECGDVPVLQLLLQSEASLEHQLRADAEHRGKGLRKTLVFAVQQCKKAFESTYKPRTIADIIQALVAPPAHWYPLPPDLLVRAVRKLIRLVDKDYSSHRLSAVIAPLSQAGADLDMGGGALLMSAVKHNHWQVVDALIDAGANVSIHGRAAIDAAKSPLVASVLLQAGAPVGPDLAIERRLLGWATGGGNHRLGPLLASLEPYEASDQSVSNTHCMCHNQL
jgi:hypothetical protein